MIDEEAARLALIDAQASVVRAADRLGVRPAELRKLMATRPELADVVLEAAERDLDKAEQIILDGMDSGDKLKRLEAAARILKSRFRGSR